MLTKNKLTIESIILIFIFSILMLNFGGIFPQYELFQRITIINLFFIYLFIYKIKFESYLIPCITIVILSLFNILWLADNALTGVSAFFYILPCILSYLFFRHVSLTEQNIEIVISIMYLSVVLMSVECFLRFFYPDLILTDGQREMSQHFMQKYEDYNVTSFLFYIYKLSSISFFDSNYVGIFLFYMWLLNDLINYKKSRLFLSCVIYLLILLSLSRASILMSTFCILLINFYKNGKQFKLFLIACTICLSPFIFAKVLNYILTDSSFGTKLLIFSDLVSFFDKPLFNQMIGYGFPLGGYIYSYDPGIIFAHSLYPLLLGQIGFLGFVIYNMLLLFLVVKYKSLHVFSVVIFMLVVGFSLINPWDPIVFGLLGIFVNWKLVNFNNYG